MTKKMTKKIKTYCYGKLHAFSSREAAKKFYLEGMLHSEGSERERYGSIYEKLLAGCEPYCDCDGVKPEKRGKTTFSPADIARFHEVIREKKNTAIILDSLRAKLDLLKEEFNKENADLIHEIAKTSTKWNTLALEEIHFNKLGLKA